MQKPPDQRHPARGLIPLLACPIALLALLAPVSARAQDYRFPGADAHYSFFYPTAYKDHGGVDWNCGDIRYDGHNGTDFGGGSWDGMAAGRDIVAAAVGVVTETNDGAFDECTTADCPGGGGYGNYVRVVHPDGKSTYYGHLKNGSVAVSVGQFVECGALLGQMGSSGHSTGPHLHFAVLNMSGNWEDPFDGPCSGPPPYWVDQGEYDALPATTCDDDLPACATTDLLTCGAVVQSRNDAAGSTDQHGYYGCGTEWVYSGPELGYRFVTDTTETVTIDLTGLAADLSLHVLASDACHASDCVGYADESQSSDEQVTLQAVAGTTYVIMVEGWDGATSDFRLAIGCTGGLPGGVDAGPEAEADAALADAAEEGADVTPAQDSSPSADAGESGGNEEASADALDDSAQPADAVGEAALPDGNAASASDPSGGCGCTTPASRDGRSLLWVFVVGLWALQRRRRTATRPGA